MDEPESVKVVLLGESGVGKTSIISQFTTNKFNPRCATSVSAQFISKTIEFPQYQKIIKFDIWDTVGQEKYRSLAKIFYKDAKIIIFVYDITTEFSFNALKEFWHKETMMNADNDPIFAVVANKIDLYQEQQVENKDGKAFADSIKAIFQTTSAMSNSGITNLFENLGKKFINPDFDYNADDKEAKENYMKRKNEEKEGNNPDKKDNTKLKLNKNNNKDDKNGNPKKGCC
jgi:small GTP-binding protein